MVCIFDCKNGSFVELCTLSDKTLKSIHDACNNNTVCVQTNTVAVKPLKGKGGGNY